MRVEIHSCDRCGERVEPDDLSTVSVRALPGRNGRGRELRPAIELCPVCVVDLASWATAGRAAPVAA